MHLLIPYAAPRPEAGPQVLAALQLPHLAALFARWVEAERDEGDEAMLSPPHERALARARGWPVVDGLLPYAAAQAADAGLVAAGDDRGWALLTPSHWMASADQVTLVAGDVLQLAESESRAIFDALVTLTADGDWRLAWLAPTRWLAAHPSLAGLPTASLDRVAGRNITPWLTRDPRAAALRRFQAEAQMLLHAHPVNVVREARGLPAVNSFWVSGTGPVPAQPRAAEPVIEGALRACALADEWEAWARAWQRIDATAVKPLLDAAGGDPATAQLTLCGERSAVSWRPRARGAWRRWFGPRALPIAPILDPL